MRAGKRITKRLLGECGLMLLALLSGTQVFDREVAAHEVSRCYFTQFWFFRGTAMFHATTSHARAAGVQDTP